MGVNADGALIREGVEGEQGADDAERKKAHGGCNGQPAAQYGVVRVVCDGQRVYAFQRFSAPPIRFTGASSMCGTVIPANRSIEHVPNRNRSAR